MAEERIWKENESRDSSRQVNGPVKHLTSHDPQASAHINAPLNLIIQFNGSPSNQISSSPSIQVAGAEQDYFQSPDGRNSNATLEIPIDDVLSTFKVDINERSKGRVAGRQGHQVRSFSPLRAASADRERTEESRGYSVNDSREIQGQLADITAAWRDTSEKLKLANIKSEQLAGTVSQLREENEKLAARVAQLQKDKKWLAGIVAGQRQHIQDRGDNEKMAGKSTGPCDDYEPDKIDWARFFQKSCAKDGNEFGPKLRVTTPL
jgi:hypothetical protein